MSAGEVSLCLALSVIFESTLLIFFTGYINRYSRKIILSISFLLRALSFVIILNNPSPPSWYIFFFLSAIARSISKPFTREVISETLKGEELKKSLTFYSFFQNASIVLAPIIASFSIKINSQKSVFIFLVITEVLMSILSLKIMYSFPKNHCNDDNSKSLITTLKSGLIGLGKNKDMRKILYSSFFCFAIMGAFITSTTLLSRISSDFSDLTGPFFSIVGFTVCIWQGVISRFTSTSELFVKIMTLCFGFFCSIYLMGNIFVAIFALISYSVYESIIVPHIYYKSSSSEITIPKTVFFSFILVCSNFGEACGSWLTGIAIDTSPQNTPVFLLLFILVAVILSVKNISSVKLKN